MRAISIRCWPFTSRLWSRLFALLEKHILPTDLKELKKIVSEEQQRIAKVEREYSN